MKLPYTLSKSAWLRSSFLAVLKAGHASAHRQLAVRRKYRSASGEQLTSKAGDQVLGGWNRMGLACKPLVSGSSARRLGSVCCGAPLLSGLRSVCEQRYYCIRTSYVPIKRL